MDRTDVEVVGNPRQFAIVQAAFERQEIGVSGPLPMERRGGIIEPLVWIFVAIGLDRGVDAAVAEIRERWPEIQLTIRRRPQD